MEKITICSKQDFIDLMRSSGKPLRRIAIESKTPQTTFENWLYGHSVPSLENVCKVLSAIGYELIAVAKENENDV